jgi:hypothetical protein
MKSKFWFLSLPEKTEKLAEWDHDMDYEGTIRCPVNSGHQRPGPRRGNLSVVLPPGEVHDFVWTSIGECLVQSEVLELFRSAGITGFEAQTVAARFRGEASKAVPKLVEIVVTGWAGKAPPESGVHLIEAESCQACGLLVYSAFTNASVLIDANQWDGSDIFMVWPLPRYIFVTDRVANLIHEHELTGLLLRPLEELSPSADRLTPGRLSRWMPTPWARQLGEPLGIY